MSDQTLALLGGKPLIGAPLTLFNTIGEDDLAAASEVIRSGVLSAYIGAAGAGFGISLLAWRTIRKMTKAMIRKSITAVTNEP